MTRVGVLCSSFDGGAGAELVARNWCRSLERAGFAITQITYDKSEPGAAFVGAQQRRMSLRLPRLRSRVRLAIKKQEIAALICVGTYANLIGLGSRRLLPVIISEHNIPSVLLRQEGVRGRMKRWYAKLAYKRAAAVVCVSHASLTDLLVNYAVSPTRACVLPNLLWEVAPVAVPVPQRTDDSPIVLTFVGRLSPQKAPSLVIATAEELAQRGLVVAVEFVGAGPLETSLREEAARASCQVAFLGWLTDWPRALEPRPNRCLLLPSMVEGFGNVLVEAAAHGIPVVVPSQALGVADAVLPGVTGEFALDRSASALADAVLASLSRQTASAPDSWLARFAGQSGPDITTVVIRTLKANHA